MRGGVGKETPKKEMTSHMTLSTALPPQVLLMASKGVATSSFAEVNFQLLHDFKKFNFSPTHLSPRIIDSLSAVCTMQLDFQLILF